MLQMQSIYKLTSTEIKLSARRRLAVHQHPIKKQTIITWDNKRGTFSTTQCRITPLPTMRLIKAIEEITKVT